MDIAGYCVIAGLIYLVIIGAIAGVGWLLGICH